MSEVQLGAIDPARERIAAVIETMPILPMPEIAAPRTLDAAAVVLWAAGQLDAAAIALGRAAASELPPSIIPRPLDAVREALVEQLGPDETDVLTARGAVLGVEAALAQVLAWLQEG